MKLEILSQKKYCNNLALLHSPTNIFFFGEGGVYLILRRSTNIFSYGRTFESLTSQIV